MIKNTDMENSNLNAEDQHSYISWQKGNRRGKIMGGVFVVAFGILFLLREANVYVADWIFSWEMILIAVGTITLVKHKFRKMFGYVLIAVGGLFLHLGEHVTDDLGGIIGCLWWARDLYFVSHVQGA